MKIDYEKYKDYLISCAKQLLSTASPTGYYNEVMKVVESYATSNGAKFSLTNKGCAVITLSGKDTSKTLGLCAHCDTLGAMVRSIKSDGHLLFSLVGGALLPSLDGEYCTIITRSGKKYSGTILSESPSVHVYPDAKTLPRDEAHMYIRLDELVSCVKDTENLGISSGDYIAFDTKTEFTSSGYLKSRFLDDKASVAILLTLLHILYEERVTPSKNLMILITMFEEVGHGASYIPTTLESMLAVDMGCVGLDLNCTEQQVSICAKDSRTPYDYALTSRLVESAKADNINYAVDIYPFYGSDVGAMWQAGYDIPAGLIGTGVHASHGMERTHIDGMLNTLRLISSYIEY
ncbi:MAG: M42 family metallopeptidase [Clostridia bacterium]